MNVLAKKTLRDLWKAKLRTITIIAAIALSVGIGIGMVNASQDAYRSFDQKFKATNYEDMKITFDTTHIDISQIQAIDGVDSVMGRLFLHTQCNIAGTEYETHWIATPYYNQEPYAKINGYQLSEGLYLSSPEAKEALVGSLFAKANSVSVGDNVEINYGNSTLELKVVGIVSSPEYIYVLSDTGWPEPSKLLPIFTSYTVAANALNLTNGEYNQLAVKAKTGYNFDTVKDSVDAALLADGVRITQSTLGTQEADYQFAKTDAGSLTTIGWAFGAIVIFTSAVIIYNTINRLIASQRAYIGVMQALGGYKRDIIVHYCLFGFLMGLIGTLIGIGLGVGLNYLTVVEYAGVLDFASPVTTVFWQYLVIFGGLGLGICTLAAFLGSTRALNIGPRMALTSQYLTESYSHKPMLERLFERFLGPNKILARVPLRNLFRHGRRTTITVLAIAVSMVLVVSSMGLTLNFIQPLQRNYNDYEKWDLKVTLAGYQGETQVLDKLSSPTMNGLKGEVMIDDYTGLKTDSGVKFVHIQAFEDNSALRSFNVIKGTKDLKNGVLVGSVLAKKRDIKVGDTLTFIMANQTSHTKVTGITGELLDDSVLMTLDTASNLFNTGAFVNSIILDTGSLSHTQIESMVRSNFNVASFVYTADVLDGMTVFLNGVIALMSVFILFGVVAEVLFISSTVVLNIIERDLEFISLRAIGTDSGRILRMVTNESLLLLVPSVIIGIVISDFSTSWITSSIVKDLMYYKIVVGAPTYVAAIVIAIISAYLASYVSARHITKLKLVDAIRQRMLT